MRLKKNIPTQQIYIDKSNNAIATEETDNRLDDVYTIGVTMVENIKKIGILPVNTIIDDVMKTEPFCYYPQIKQKLLESYAHEYK